MPEIGDKVFFKNGPTGHAQQAFIVGQTSRSWYMSASQNPWWASEPKQLARLALRYEKKEVLFIDEEMFALENWAASHRISIQSQIWRISAEQLKQVAAIIGYEQKIA